MRLIGTDGFGFHQMRNFAGVGVEGYHFKQVYDYMHLFNNAYMNFKNKPHPYCNYFFRDFGLNRVELYHFFNKIYFGKKSWLVTFDHELPRFNTDNYPGMYALAADNCTAIFAISRRAYDSQIFHMHRYEYEVCVEIEGKMHIQPPSQMLHVNSVNEKYEHDLFTFTFVGSEFYRKGGQEVLLVAHQLKREGYTFRLNIVSDFKLTNLHDSHIEEADIALTHKLMDDGRDWINHTNFLNHYEIIELFKNSDVALFPSYGDDFDYLILDAQACGTPVISTNVPPLNEINSNEAGWLCIVPIIFRKGVMSCDIYRPGKLSQFREVLLEELYRCMAEGLNNHKLTIHKGTGAIKRIVKEHAPADTADFLSKLYGRS